MSVDVDVLVVAAVVLAVGAASISAAAPATATPSPSPSTNATASNVSTSTTATPSPSPSTNATANNVSTSRSTDTPRPTPRARSTETDSSTDATDVEAERTVTVAPSQDVNTSEVLSEVDSRLVVVSQSYDPGPERFTVVLRNTGSRSSDVTLSEVISRQNAGAGSFGIKQFSVSPGEKVEVSVSASRVRGTAAVMVLTQESVEDGSGTYLQESRAGGGGLLSGRASGADVRAAVAFTGVGTLLAFLTGVWSLVARRNRDVVPVSVSPSGWLGNKLRRK